MVVEAIPGNEQITVSISGELLLVSEIPKRRGERKKKTLSLLAASHSLSASDVGLLALSRRKISRKTSGPRVAVNQFADDLKIVVQVVHTDGQVIVTEGLGADYVPPSLPVEL